MKNSQPIADHDGIVAIAPSAEGERIEITFDPSRLSEEDIRQMALEHLRPEGFQQTLHGLAGEDSGVRRIEGVSGARRASVTYIGRVLCLTFDSAATAVKGKTRGVKKAHVKVPGARPGFWQRATAGELNDELSCGLGLLCLLLAWALERQLGQGWGTNLLYLGAYVLCGQAGVRSAIASLREKTLDVDVLMVLAALGAGIVGAPFEGALLLFLFSFSNVLQSYALERTRRAIESLLTLRPDTALKKTGDIAELVAVDSLEPGDIVMVRPGELLPVDGLVAEGTSSVDQASLTGESMPVAKSVGAKVFAGTMNQTGALEITVTKKAEDSTLARIVRLVAEAQAEKSGTQRFLENAEKSYAAGVIALTVVVFLVPWLGWGETFASAFYRAMTLMVVASPCALVISTPATVLSAIGGAARRGILIKGGAHLEQAARVDIVAIDKTGTLTTGKPTVTDIILPGGSYAVANGPLAEEARALLAIAASLESKSEHPLAAAMVAGAQKLNLTLPLSTAFQSTPGKGAEADIEGTHYILGSERLFEELGAVNRSEFTAAPSQCRGKTCVWMGESDGSRVRVRAVFAMADTMRPEAKNMVARLHAVGVRKIVMLTGDQNDVAAAIGAEAGVDEFRAELLPEDKLEAIRELKREGTVMMIGDGVNDAPALATADLGVSMGAAGTDVAMETADVVLMGDKLENIAVLLGMARHARRVLIQNLVFAGLVIVTLIIAALGFRLPLPMGVIGHEGSTVLVCLNGLRLLAYRPKR
jgi:Cd2+/Zn2+-exporting ATPase